MFTLVHAWYLGNAAGDAIADVVFGKHNPSGKLSLTLPKRLEDVPAHGYFHSENGRVHYSEGIFVVRTAMVLVFFNLPQLWYRVINTTNTVTSSRLSPLGTFLVLKI